MTKSADDNMMTTDLIRLMPVGLPAWRKTEIRDTEFDIVKFCISVFLHEGRPISISLMFSFIDNGIEAFTCMCL